jgi:putative transposase
MRRIATAGHGGSGDFEQIVDAFLLRPGLPFSEILSAERIERIFARHGNLFGLDGVYSTMIMVWAFLGQVLRDGKEASCQSAVARIVTHQHHLGRDVPTNDTGDYCRARAKLSEAALHDLATEVAAEVEQQAESAWLWKDQHVKLIDGFTFTMPDTPANQATYPQARTQKPGVGQPIARACAIVSLATGCVLELAVGPYHGKETGETALLRELQDSLSAGDIALFDRHYCSFLMMALLLSRGLHVCTRLHQRRHADFRRGKRLGHDDHVIVWTKPECPEWMDEATYRSLPDQLELRELRYEVHTPGFRVGRITVVTTLTDAALHGAEEIAELYGKRWHVELDIRALKQTLGAEHLRCKSPQMVRRELWTKVLAYNLIRTTIAAAASLHSVEPRQISFTTACQYVLSSWSLLSSGCISQHEALLHCRLLLQQIAHCIVGDRPGRCEPRVLKRRRHHYPHMQQPRTVLRAKLLKGK